MTGTIRIDFADGPLERPRRLPDGSAIYSGRAARTGDHKYPWGVERRDHDELTSIVRQLPGKPVVVNHPQVLLSRGGVASIVGRVVRAEVRGDHAVVDVHLTYLGIEALKAGTRELSLGYETTPVDGRQTRTRVDHLALVRAARCGATCEVRVDCTGGCTCQPTEPPAPAPEARVSNLMSAMRGANR